MMYLLQSVKIVILFASLAWWLPVFATLEVWLNFEFPGTSVFAFFVDCSLSPAPLATVFSWSQAMWNLMLEEWGSREMAGETCLPRICVYCLYFL